MLTVFVLVEAGRNRNNDQSTEGVGEASLRLTRLSGSDVGRTRRLHEFEIHTNFRRVRFSSLSLSFFYLSRHASVI